jgi:hypothetical protein
MPRPIDANNWFIGFLCFAPLFLARGIKLTVEHV